MQHHVIVNVAIRCLVPLILLFALYVQFHGDFGPGGGFQAGVIFGAGIIAYGLGFGVDRAMAAVSRAVAVQGMALGLLLYAGVGVVCMILGGNYLDYHVLARDPQSAQHLGILLIELGVGITVASVMVSLFYSFATHRGG